VELVGSLLVGAGVFGAGVWLAVSRGSALRRMDAAAFRAAGLADERDIAARKMAAMSSTIIKLERLVIAGGGDSRNLLSVLSEHRRLLSEADRGDPTIPRDVHPRPAPPPTPRPPGVPTSPGLLVPDLGDGDRGLDDPRDALARRGGSLPGDPIE